MLVENDMLTSLSWKSSEDFFRSNYNIKMPDLEAAMVVKLVRRCLSEVTNVQMKVSFILCSFDELQGGTLFSEENDLNVYSER